MCFAYHLHITIQCLAPPLQYSWIRPCPLQVKMLAIVQAPNLVRVTVRRYCAKQQLSCRERMDSAIRGDTLSPLLFCLWMAPLPTTLRRAGGFHSKFQTEPITHLAYMDDVKLFDESPQEVQATMNTAARALGNGTR